MKRSGLFLILPFLALLLIQPGCGGSPSSPSKKPKTPTNTRTSSETQNPTGTATPTSSPTLTDSPTSTATSTQSLTPSPTLSATLTPSPTSTPTLSHTTTPPPTSTNTLTQTPTPSLTPTPTKTPGQCGFQTGPNDPSGSTDSLFNANQAETSPVTLSVDGLVTDLQVYIASNVGSQIRAALYGDSGGVPGTLKAQSGSQTSVAGWNIFDITDTPLTAGVYWLAVNTNGLTGIAYFPNGTGRTGTLSFGSFPGTLSAPNTNTDTFAFYMDYCVTGNNPTPGITPTSTTTPTFTLTSTVTKTETPYCNSPYQFGQGNSLGASNSLFNVNQVETSPFVLPVGGIVTKIHVYVAANVGNQMRAAIYTDNSGSPDAFLSESNPQITVSGWNDFDIPDTGLLTAGTYWLAVNTNGLTGIAYYTGGTGRTGTLSFGPFPGTLSAPNANSDTFAFYADYCVVGGSPTPGITATQTSTPTLTVTATQTSTEVPLCANPTPYGQNTPTGSSNALFNANQVETSPVTLATGGKVTMIHVYVGANAGNQMSAAIYTDNSGVPLTLLSKSNPKTCVGGWNDFDIPDTALLSAGVYWLAVNTNGLTGISYFTGGTSKTFNQSFGTYPSPVNPASLNPGTDAFLFYADTCP